MKVYYYCSYTRSPVGFRLGMVDTDDVRSETCELTGEGIQPFIRRCFYQGSVRSAHGLIPKEAEETDQYFLLIKSNKPLLEGDTEYFINFALVTDQREEYERWVQYQSQDENALFQAVRDTILLNGPSEFGFSVRTAGLRALMEAAYSTHEAGPTSTDGVYVEALLPRSNSAQLSDILGLTECSVSSLNHGNWYVLKKNKCIRG